MTTKACQMVARSDWGVGNKHQGGLTHAASVSQSPIGLDNVHVQGWLVFLNGPHRGEDFRICFGKQTIGASWHNDIVLTGPDIGSRHAIITANGEHTSLARIDPTRLLLVNGTNIQTADLRDGDVIQIGELGAAFRSSERLEKAPQPPIQEQYAAGFARSGEKSMATLGWLVGQMGEVRGKDFRLIHGENRLGRKVGLEISLGNLGMDLACVIDCAPQGIFIRQGSADAQVQVNGVDLGGERKVLKDSDALRIANMEFYLKCL